MGLRASGHAFTLIALYMITVMMRGAFYVTIAVIQSDKYLPATPPTTWDVALVLMIYPVSELVSVSFFGSYSDKIGRKPILTASLLMTAYAAFLFAITPDKVFIFAFAVLFGLGAASQVSTSLSMIADCSTEYNRARLMGYFDLATLGGLGGGYGAGILLINAGMAATTILFTATLMAAAGTMVASLLLRETRKAARHDISIGTLLRKVVRDRRIQKLMPVYIPIISLYGLVIANAESILEEHFTLQLNELMILFAMLGGALVLGIVVMGHLSDYLLKRRPFIVVGLIGFGLLAYLLVSNAEHFEALWGIWPVLPLLGFLAGSFPPAAMAYLTDVSSEEARGSTMGVYSIFFGTGMIIGPTTGAFAYTNYGIWGLGVVVAILIGVAIIGTYFMSEAHSQAQRSEISGA